MAPKSRLRMRDWLCGKLNDNNTPGLYWEDKKHAVFRINWKHGSRHGYSADTDAVVFRMWAEYTGKVDSNAEPDPKRWKANFRCALNSLKDVKQVNGKCNRGVHAYRLYQFVDHSCRSRRQPIRSKDCLDKIRFVRYARKYPRLFDTNENMDCSTKHNAQIKMEPTSFYEPTNSTSLEPLTPPLTPEDSNNGNQEMSRQQQLEYNSHLPSTLFITHDNCKDWELGTLTTVEHPLDDEILKNYKNQLTYFDESYFDDALSLVGDT